MLEFYTALPVYLFLLASQWFHTFELFSNLHFLGLTFFFSGDVFGIGYHNLFWNSTSHKNTCMHFVSTNCLFREFLGGTGGLSIEVPFKTGFAVIAHHKNNNVLIPPYNQLTSISCRNLLFIFLYLYAKVKLHKYVLYNMFLLINT